MWLCQELPHTDFWSNRTKSERSSGPVLPSCSGSELRLSFTRLSGKTVSRSLPEPMRDSEPAGRDCLLIEGSRGSGPAVRIHSRQRGGDRMPRRSRGGPHPVRKSRSLERGSRVPGHEESSRGNLLDDQHVAILSVLGTSGVDKIAKVLAARDASGARVQLQTAIQSLRTEVRQTLDERIAYQAGTASRARRLFLTSGIICSILIIVAGWQFSLDLGQRELFGQGARAAGGTLPSDRGTGDGYDLPPRRSGAFHLLQPCGSSDPALRRTRKSSAGLSPNW